MKESTSDRLSAVFQPRRFAVLGASSPRFTLGNFVLRHLRQQGYAGSVLAVSARASSLEGYSAVPAIEEVPPDLDAAMVRIPAPALPGVLGRLDSIGCRSAVVPTAGFSSRQYAEL